MRLTSRHLVGEGFRRLFILVPSMSSIPIGLFSLMTWAILTCPWYFSRALAKNATSKGERERLNKHLEEGEKNDRNVTGKIKKDKDFLI